MTTTEIECRPPNIEQRFRALTTPRGLVMSTTREGMVNIAQVAAALSKAQGEFRAVPKGREVEVRMKSGGKYSFAYAELQDILAMARKPLAENGLAVVFGVENLAGKVSVSATLIHSSGEYIQSTITGAYSSDMKELGGAVSYLKRYAVQSVLGIATGDESIAVEGRSENEPDAPPEDARISQNALKLAPGTDKFEARSQAESAANSLNRKNWINDTLAKRGLGAGAFRKFIEGQQFSTEPAHWARWQMQFFSVLFAEMELAQFDFTEVEIWLGSSMPLGKMTENALASVCRDVASDGWANSVRQVNRQALGAR